jgi:tRNA-modifying protein YgfZ
MGDDLAWSTIGVIGPDAETFLNGQLSQDLTTARAGAWTTVLEPSGEVLTSGWVRGDDEAFELLVPTELADEVAQRLRRFKLRVKCDLVVENGGDGAPIHTVTELFEQRWPWVAEFARSLAPPCFGQRFVQATVSFTKGCFTGQELVGRLDARGATMPWRLVVATGPSLAAVESALASAGPEGPRGVTSSRVVSDGVEALGFAHRSLLARTDPHDGVVIEEVP